MSEQILDNIQSKHPNIDFGELKPFRIFVRCDGSLMGTGYEMKSMPASYSENDLGFSTSLYRDYVATFELRESGELFVVKYDFPFSKRASCIPEEQIRGNFTLVMKTSFYSWHTAYIPFYNSKIEADKRKWSHEELTPESLVITIESEVDNSTVNNRPDGFDVGGIFIVPQIGKRPLKRL